MALTKVTGDFIKDGVLTVGHLHTSHGITTAHIGEGSNLYFTNARVDARIGDLSTSDLSEGTNLYYTDARVGSYLTTNSYATQSYVNTQVSNLVDSAPSTLDTLNELAAALGDDANFSTTVTNSIATKMPLAGGTFTGQVNFSVAPFLTQGVDLVFKAASGSTDPGDLVWRDGSNNERHRIWDGTNTLNYRTASGTTYQLIHSGYSSYNNSNWDTAYTYSQVGHLPLSGGTLTGNLTISGSNTLEVFGFLYTRSTLRVLNSAGTGWHNWATRAAGKYNLNVNNIIAAEITASDDINISAGKKLAYSSNSFMTPENNVTGAEISTAGDFRVKTGSTPTLGLTVSGSQNVTIAGYGLFQGSTGNTPTGSGTWVGLTNGYGNIQFNGSGGGHIDFASSGVDYAGRIIYFNSNDSFIIYTNAAQAITIDSSQNTTFAGNVTASSGTGHFFCS